MENVAYFYIKFNIITKNTYDEGKHIIRKE